MTSSIYPILPSFVITITTPGSGYITTPTVTIDSPPLSSGITATGKATIANGVIDTITAIGGTNSGYTTGEEVTLSGGTGIDATGIADISGGEVLSITFTNRGSGFISTDVITITGATSEADDATFIVNTIANGAVSSILTKGGSGYTTEPTVTITGGGGSGATAVAIFAISSAPAGGANILTDGVTITSDMVSPGGGGVVRLYFSFVVGAPATITVFNNSVSKGILNADNAAEVFTNGYYRFDLDVEVGDKLNFRSDEDITTVNFMRLHLVQFGA